MEIFSDTHNPIEFDRFKADRAQQSAQAMKEIGSSDNTNNVPKREKLAEVARGFESMFINLLMSQMRKTIPKSELIDGGQAQEIFEKMFDDEISKIIAQRGDLGIANALMKQFEHHYGMEDKLVHDGREA
jgi:flagellar protein FlgJ